METYPDINAETQITNWITSTAESYESDFYIILESVKSDAAEFIVGDL